MRRTMGVVAVVVVAAATAITGNVASALTGPNVVVNGGFETASFSGWTTGGTSTGIVGTAHTGSFAAQLGSATPTSSNSTLQQVVTIPPSATLSFWYQPHCADTLAHDQEQMQLRTTGGVTLVPVLNVCSNSGVWTQVNRSLAAYRGLTLQLWFNNHDDNHAGDATFTLFDDVSVTGTVPGNDFSISANPPSVTVAQGSTATTTVSPTLTNGSSQTVSLSASGLPAGVTASFSPSTVTAGGSATLKLTASATAPAGTSTVTVTGAGTSTTHTTTVSLTVTSVSANDFSISANPSSVTVAQGAGGTSTISTTLTSGSAQSVSLSASGLPSGAGASFSPSSVTAGGSSTMTITTSAVTPGGTSTITVTGTGTSATHNTTVTLTVTTAPPPGLLQLSSDGYTNTSSEHATEVEPDTLSNGTTMVSAFQVGRFNNGGSDDIGWATSTDSGQTWNHGLLPGITTFQGGGVWARASDPSVAYDAKHGVWLIASLILDTSATGRGVDINRSADGLTWASATNAVTSTGAFLDKDWIVCDSISTSPFYGNCYVEYDNNSSANMVQMLTSTDGGLTWSAPKMTADVARGLGGQPLVQPNGTVVVPYLADTSGQIRSFVSTNGGTSWAGSVLVASSSAHKVAGNMRTTPLPSAEIDAAGTVYVAWQDCRFRSGCTANDIVVSSSTTGATWSAVQRVPIDPTTSGVDHFIPGLAVDRSTSGAAAHLALYYYFYPTASCNVLNCQLDVGFVSSSDGGATWSGGTQIAGPSTLSQIAATTEGAMVGDYISTSFLAGRAYGVFAIGQAPSGSTYNEPMYTVTGGLAARAARGGTTPGEVWSGGLVATESKPLTAF